MGTMEKCADEFGRLEIEPGQYITTSKGKYLITEKLGEGGYGAVFKVRRDPFDGEDFAMKVEEKIEKRKRSKLTMEMNLLRLMASQPTGKSHFGKIEDRAKKKKYFLIIMTLVGENLNDLKKQRSPPVFSLGTGFGIGIQCMEAVEELHKVGYIHRDIKPANFAIGRFPRTHLVYILDFGIARKYTNEQNVFKAPRRKVAFKGTVRFASLDCHRGKELGPKDDCESWIYMLVDFCNKDGLPWDHEKDRHMVAEKKKESRSNEGKERLFQPMCLKAMTSILDYVDGLFYQDKVDYQYLYRMIGKAGAKMGANLGAPFDWEKASSGLDEIGEAAKKKEKMTTQMETAAASPAHTSVSPTPTVQAAVAPGVKPLVRFSPSAFPKGKAMSVMQGNPADVPPPSRPAVVGHARKSAATMSPVAKSPGRKPSVMPVARTTVMQTGPGLITSPAGSKGAHAHKEGPFK